MLLNEQNGAPRAARRPVEITQHGERRVDEYAWLREKESAEVRAHLEAENAYLEAQLVPVKELREQLYGEIVARIEETDMSAPVREGAWLYYTRTLAGKDYKLYCRRAADGGDEQILIDANVLAEGREHLAIGAFAPSPDAQLLAYAVDTEGDEEFTVYVKDLRTGALLSDTIADTYYSLEWGADNRTLFYNVLDEARRPYKVLRHTLGTPQSDDVEVYHEADERFEVDVTRTRDHRYLLLDIHSHTTSEIRALASSDVQGAFVPVLERVQGVEMDVEHREGRWYVRTRDGAENFRLVSMSVHATSRPNWREEIAARADVTIECVDVFADYMVVTERSDALVRFRVREFATNEEHYIEWPDAVYAAETLPVGEYASNVVRIEYSSLTRPETAYDYDLRARTLTVVKRERVVGHYDETNYVSERVWARSHDGVRVPLSIVYRKGVKLDGTNPALLYGYGAYGISIDAAFAHTRISLLDRGFVFAVAHIRGGGDLGKSWHEAGRMERKTNTFADFIAAAETLIERGYTSPKKLAVHGRSAGGLLIGAVLNLRPDLFGAAIAGVPFVDVLNTMSDATLPLTIGEYEEWGNPEERAAYERMRGYAPYENVRAANYPHVLATAGLNDPRVSYWEPAKWVARLRDKQTGASTILMKVSMGAGHFGASARYEKYRETALEYAFLIHTLGANARSVDAR